ncbi:unnamed protein product [Caenorhabditis angaria]|uniref:Saposin B-type domain-containing protein n=1 Tax=Caenorhabditis angaria TaxID=860376 RepID=A0A9P1MV29_9PELO|nr:unnamed protein product [Caenorhabditis angaria]
MILFPILLIFILKICSASNQECLLCQEVLISETEANRYLKRIVEHCKGIETTCYEDQLLNFNKMKNLMNQKGYSAKKACKSVVGRC